MTTASTAFVMVGPSGVGSFHDRLWRVNPRQGQLVEGGSNGPYFLLGSSSEEFVFPVEDFDAEVVARSVVLLIALLIEDEQALGLLRADPTSLSRMLGYSKQIMSKHATAATVPWSSYVIDKNPRFANERPPVT